MRAFLAVFLTLSTGSPEVGDRTPNRMRNGAHPYVKIWTSHAVRPELGRSSGLKTRTTKWRW
jgi:hypothetical protein